MVTPNSNSKAIILHSRNGIIKDPALLLKANHANPIQKDPIQKEQMMYQ